MNDIADISEDKLATVARCKSLGYVGPNSG